MDNRSQEENTEGATAPSNDQLVEINSDGIFRAMGQEEGRPLEEFVRYVDSTPEALNSESQNTVVPYYARPFEGEFEEEKGGYAMYVGGGILTLILIILILILIF